MHAVLLRDLGGVRALALLHLDEQRGMLRSHLLHRGVGLPRRSLAGGRELLGMRRRLLRRRLGVGPVTLGQSFQLGLLLRVEPEGALRRIRGARATLRAPRCLERPDALGLGFGRTLRGG